MIYANGENRRYIALMAGVALASALATKLGEWAVDEMRRAAGRREK